MLNIFYSFLRLFYHYLINKSLFIIVTNTEQVQGKPSKLIYTTKNNTSNEIDIHVCQNEGLDIQITLANTHTFNNQ